METGPTKIEPTEIGPTETPTQKLHRLTSYRPGKHWDAPGDDPQVLADLVTNDPERLPWFFKRYGGSLPLMPLPRELPKTSASTVDVLAGTAAVRSQDLDLPQLSRLLHLSAGVVRTAQRPVGTLPFRAAGSAGGRFPLELYAAIPEGFEVPGGTYWYHPQEHALVRIGAGPVGECPAIVVTGVPWRTGWRYRERGFRHVYWDAGTMLSQFLAAAASAGLPASLYTRFPDASVTRLVGADGVHEWPVAVIALGEGRPALTASGSVERGDVDSAPLEFPLVTAAQHAGDGEVLGDPWPFPPLPEMPAQPSPPVEASILARGSQRRMVEGQGLPQALLHTAMLSAVRGITFPHFVVAHEVGQLVPGVYRWPELSSAVRPGNLREELYRICLDQGLAREAAFVVFTAATVGELDDRQYREAQLAAGLVSGRLHLLAYALGASATGMTFLDSEIPALVGEPLDALLFSCVGVPEYRNAAGGTPGRPTSVRSVESRVGD